MSERNAPQRALDAPAATDDAPGELKTEVRLYGERTVPVISDAPEDPFRDLYGVRKDGKEGALKDTLAGAHAISEWIAMRKTERGALAGIVAEAQAFVRETRSRLRKGEGSSDEHDVARSSASMLEAGLRAVVSRVVKADGSQDPVETPTGKVLLSHALEVEDDKAGLVEVVSRNMIIEPTFHPAVLEQLCLQNNTLLQLIEAMEINVAGTGWEIVRDPDAVEAEKRDQLLDPEADGDEDAEDDDSSDDDPDKEQSIAKAVPAFLKDKAKGTGKKPKPGEAPDPEDPTDPTAKLEELALAEEAEAEVDRAIDNLRGFFKEPYPNTTTTSLKRKLRVDLERTGNAYVEVIEDEDGTPLLARHVDTKLMRLVRLDAPVLVEHEMDRFGKKVKLQLATRERRFVLQVGGGATVPRFHHSPTSGAGLAQTDTGRLFTSQGTRVVYFKELGASRDLDMWTGQWAQPGEKLPPQRRATSMYHLTLVKDPRTPYGLPRWINVLPAVLGSRRAEEFNLSFFDQGGVPPLLITVAGGRMAEKTRDALEKRFNSKNPASKHQAIVMEVEPSGRMDKGQQRIAVTVERFGSDRTQDAMFQKYDERSGQVIRSSFRLPPAFIGLSEEHTFASLQGSYLLAEAQVFAPERQEDDEFVNLLLLRRMPGSEGYIYRSKPLVVDDATQQVLAVTLAAEQGWIDAEGGIKALNKITNLGLSFNAKEHAKRQAEDAQKKQVEMGVLQARAEGRPLGPQKPGGPPPFQKSELDGLVALGLELADLMLGGADRSQLTAAFSKLSELTPLQMDRVKRVVSLRTLGGDSETLQELAGCTAATLAGR